MGRVVRRCMPHWFRIGVCRRSALLTRETSGAARVLYSRHGVRVGCGEPVRTGDALRRSCARSRCPMRRAKPPRCAVVKEGKAGGMSNLPCALHLSFGFFRLPC